MGFRGSRVQIPPSRSSEVNFEVTNLRVATGPLTPRCEWGSGISWSMSWARRPELESPVEGGSEPPEGARMLTTHLLSRSSPLTSSQLVGWGLIEQQKFMQVKPRAGAVRRWRPSSTHSLTSDTAATVTTCAWHRIDVFVRAHCASQS